MLGRLLKIIFILGLMMVVVTGAVYFNVGCIGSQYAYQALSDIPESETAIILGARVYQHGGVSPVLEDRLLTGIELYREGKVKKLLLSGDHGQNNYDEVNSMRKYVLAAGVPEEDVFMDHAGFSTYDSMYRARDIFQISNVVVVTQDFHLDRALYIARKIGLEAVGLPADKRDYLGIDYMAAREIPARVKAAWQLMIKDKPKYLGDVIPITGDGRATWDQL